MDYTVDLDGRMPAPVQDEDLGLFLSALERRVIAPAVSYNTESRLLGARFIISASTATAAATVATDAFCDALKEVGLSGSIHFTKIHVAEEHEEAATIA